MKIFLFLIIILFLLGCGSQEITVPVKETTKEIVAKKTPTTENIQKKTPSTKTISKTISNNSVTAKAVEETKPIPTNPNLIAHWKFDGDAKETISNLDGTIKGGASFKTGKVNQALSFDGVDDYVDLPQSAITKIGSLSKGTIAFWFNYQSILDKQTLMPIIYLGIKDGNPSDNMYIIEIGHSALDGMSDRPDPSDKKIYSTWIKNHQEPFLCFDSTNNIAENQWHHFAVAVSDSGNTGYLNGVEITNRDYNFGSASDKHFLSSISTKEIFTLGYGRSSYMIGKDFMYYKGLLDDLRVYDKSLSGEEIKKLVRK